MKFLQPDFFETRVVSVEDEHTFRRWQSGVSSEELGKERGLSEMQMMGVIASIWRKLGRQ